MMEAGRGDRDQERRSGLSPTPHSTTPRMSQIRPTPEVMSLVAPPSFSWMRIFLSLSVLLVFLLIALFSPKSAKPISMKKARSGVRSVLLVGPLASGKTALFSKVRSIALPLSRDGADLERVTARIWSRTTISHEHERE